MSSESTSAAEISLAADFDTPSQADWEKEVLKVLNRRRPEGKELSIEQAYKRLNSSTIDGLDIKPLYMPEDGAQELGYPGVAPFKRGTTVRSGEMDDGWFICQLQEDPDAKRSREAVLTDLERGGSAVWLRIGPDALDASAIPEVLADALLELIPVHVSSLTDQMGAAKALLAHMEAGDKPNEAMSGTLGIDPIGFAALHGTEPDLSVLTEAVEMAKDFPQIRPVVVDATIFHNAGAGDVHELAYAIAVGIEYVRALVDAGHTVDEAFDAISFRVSATTDQFATIARLRALRVLWNRVGEVLEVSAPKRGAVQHAVTSFREMTRDDSYVNVLRTTIAAFAATAGQAETITVLPLDAAFGLPTDLSRRIARNIQVLLAEESNVGRINDPAGGAFFVENATTQLQDKAWALVQEIDADGFVTYLNAGKVKADLDAINDERAKALATRKVPITGVSMFPKYDEVTPQREPLPEAPEYKGLAPIRDSQVFEDLRDRSEKAREAGNSPKVFLAALGKRRDFGAREGFTSNLFHVGGIETVLGEGEKPQDFVDAFKASGADVAVLTSSAKVYAEQGMDVARALKEGGAEQVLIAGQLKELGSDDAESVIDGNIFDGMDVVELLTSTLDKVGA